MSQTADKAPIVGDEARVAELLEAGEAVGAAEVLDGFERVEEGLGRRVLDGLIRGAAWERAAGLHERLGVVSDEDRLSLNLCRNLAMLQRCRAGVYRRVFRTAARTVCRLVAGADGVRSVEQLDLVGQRVLLGAEADPLGEVAKVVPVIEPALAEDKPLMVLGMRDGHVLDWVAKRLAGAGSGSSSAVRAVSPVYVLDVHPELLIQVLMLHDWSVEGSPLTAANFHWLVGMDSAEQYRRLLDRRPSLPVSRSVLCLSPLMEDQRVLVEAVNRGIADEIDAMESGVKALAASRTREHLLDVLGERPSRRPRVLVMASLFTTVLRHSAADVAAGFEALGWEVETFIEGSVDERFGYRGLWRRLLAFEPDVVFVIDRNRAEFGDLLPEPLPVVNWVQDHLAHLCNQQAGRGVGLRDFVLLASRPTFVERYGYPERQCIDLGKLSRVPALPERWSSDGADLVYVSNASRAGEGLIETLREQLGEAEALLAVAESTARAMMAVYVAGMSIDSTRVVMAMLDEQAELAGLHWPNAEARLVVRDLLWLPVNDALYRQQGLGWAADVAEAEGLRLEIYGEGWEAHPRFGKYAQGPIGYGEALEVLTRGAKINLRLEPYPALAHQRMIDGLFAGGFYLSRSFGPERLFTALLGLVDAEAGEGVGTLAEARERVGGEVAERLERLVAGCRACYDEAPGWDPVAAGRISERLGVLRSGEAALPGLEAVSFVDEVSLAERLRRFVGDADERGRVLERQRAVAVEQFGYVGGLKRVLGEIRERVAGEAVLDERRCA